MRTVLTTWNSRIAPVFDVAGQALLVMSEDGSILSERNLLLPGGSAMEKVALLAEVRADVLICGAISRPAWCAANSCGIEVYGFIAGDVREVLRALLKGRLRDSAFAMPGCGSNQGCGRRRGLGGRAIELPDAGPLDGDDIR